MTTEEKKTVEAISVIRSFIASESEGTYCGPIPCLGCVTCNLLELGRKLQGLENYIGD